jgi:membrane-associated phospholipid phosphatase
MRWQKRVFDSSLGRGEKIKSSLYKIPPNNYTNGYKNSNPKINSLEGKLHFFCRMMKRLPPFHWLTFFFLLGLTLVSIIFHGQIPKWQFLLLNYLFLLGLLLLLNLSLVRGEGGKAKRFLFYFSPILFVILIYESLGNLIQHLRPDIDPWLIHIDFLIFGVHPTLWMEQWVVPWLTDLMSIAYGSYYFIPVSLITVLYFRDKLPELERSIFILLFGYYASFIGYILFPAIGPRFTMAHLYSVPLEGSFLTDVVRDVLNLLEHNKRDCMPSGHTQMVLMTLSLAYRDEKVLFCILFPLVCALILSTVYLRYHYVIDLIVGGGFAIGCLVIGPRLFEAWKKTHNELS